MCPSLELQGHIASLPQELQDQILQELVEIVFTPGRIQLDGYGRVAKKSDSPIDFQPNFSIIKALDRQRFSRARKLLYSSTFVMPTGIIDDEFFRLWDLATLRRLPKIELRIDIADFVFDTFFIGRRRRIARFRSASRSIGNGNRLPLPQIWSFLFFTMENALADFSPSILGDVVYREECQIHNSFDTLLAPREMSRQNGFPEMFAVFNDELRWPRQPSTQVVTVNQADMKEMLDRVRRSDQEEYPEGHGRLHGWRSEVEDKLHVAIRIVNRCHRRRELEPKFRIIIQVEGINQSFD